MRQSNIKNKTFEKRNIKRNATIRLQGLHGKKPKFHSAFKNKFLEKLYKIEERFNYYFLHRLSIPQIEFTLTTRCTLKCKNCSNYIPRLTREEQINITLEDFKLYLDNLTGAVDKIHNLLLLGGEPFLVRNLDKYLEYAAENKKIENIWITTNGTLLMSENLIAAVKKYHKKVTIWLSNYSANEELAPVLKHEKLLEQIKATGADINYVKDTKWQYVSEDISDMHRSHSDNEKYFESCIHTCMAVFGDKLFVCPRAGAFYQKKLYEFENGECVSLKNTNRKELRKQIIDFYGRNYFGACNYCRVLEDIKQPHILPALQLKSDNAYNNAE